MGKVKRRQNKGFILLDCEVKKRKISAVLRGIIGFDEAKEKGFILLSCFGNAKDITQNVDCQEDKAEKNNGKLRIKELFFSALSLTDCKSYFINKTIRIVYKLC